MITFSVYVHLLAYWISRSLRPLVLSLCILCGYWISKSTGSNSILLQGNWIILPLKTNNKNTGKNK